MRRRNKGNLIPSIVSSGAAILSQSSAGASPVGENRYLPPRTVLITEGRAGSGSIFRRIRIAFIVAQRLGVVVEPFGSKPHPRAGGHRRRARRGLRRRLDGTAAAQHRANAGQELAQLAWLGEIIVRAELEADHAIDRARRCGEHDDRHAGAPFEIADDRKTVLLRHVEIEDDQVRQLLRDGLAQAGAAVAQADAEAVHAQIVPHHVARGLLVIHHDDVLRLGHVTGNTILNVAPFPGPALSTVICPPCRSTIRLTIERPRPVEVSPAVGFAESRWKRPNNREMSSGDRPAPWSLTCTSIPPSSCATKRSMAPPIGLYLTALLTRLSIASRMRSASQMAA